MSRTNKEKKTLSFQGSTIEVTTWKEQIDNMWPKTIAEVKCPKCKKISTSTTGGFSGESKQYVRRNAISHLRSHYKREH